MWLLLRCLEDYLIGKEKEICSKRKEKTWRFTVMLFVRKPVRISKLAQFNFFVENFWIFYWNILFQVIKKIFCYTWPHFQAKFCSILFKLSNQCKYEIIRSQIKQRCATMFIFLQRPKPVINRFYTAYLKISQYVT